MKKAFLVDDSGNRPKDPSGGLLFYWVPYAPTLICPDLDPGMVLTVTGATGSITWSDEVWNLDTGDSGDPREVCPTKYTKSTGFLE